VAVQVPEQAELGELVGRGAVGPAVVAVGKPPEPEEEFVDALVAAAGRAGVGVGRGRVDGQFGDDAGVLGPAPGRVVPAEVDVTTADADPGLAGRFVEEV
jgi:hypothetical protein